MWSDLYRCPVIWAWLSASFLHHSLSSAQELVPAIASEVAPEANSPPVDVPLQLIPPASPRSRDRLLSSSTSTTKLDRLHSPLLRQDLQIHGTQACATSNCHGGPRPGVSQPWARRGMEHQIWIENDPHSRSWRTICSDESIAMMRRLKIMVGDKIVDQTGFDNCLACHNSTRRFNEPRRPQTVAHAISADTTSDRLIDAARFLREGVGCSGCHGPSEHWIHTHFQYHWSPEGATGQGFVEAGDLYVRARMCASCHVGDVDRDMNHDIIAAGHPALRYELATFHAWQPKHWRDAEANDSTYYEAQLWLAGQIASADASLALLQTRAAGSHAANPWPEFAAYNCASCHHNLGLDHDRRGSDRNRKATAIYSQWNDAGLRWLVDYRIETGEATQQDLKLLDALDEVKRTMESEPKPSADAVAGATEHARKVLADWFDGGSGLDQRHNFRSDRLGRLLASVAGKRETFDTWESAVQFYLAAVAARASWPGGWHGPLRTVADHLRDGLRYPEMIDISRFAKLEGGGPSIKPVEAMTLGIELAGGLGPVSRESLELEDDSSRADRRHFREWMDEINTRWEEQRKQRQAAAPSEVEGEPDQMDRPPPRKPKSAEELLEEFERMRDDNSTSDDSPESRGTDNAR